MHLPTATALDTSGQYFEAQLRMFRINAPTKGREPSHANTCDSFQLQILALHVSSA